MSNPKARTGKHASGLTSPWNTFNRIRIEHLKIITYAIIPHPHHAKLRMTLMSFPNCTTYTCSNFFWLLCPPQHPAASREYRIKLAIIQENQSAVAVGTAREVAWEISPGESYRVTECRRGACQGTATFRCICIAIIGTASCSCRNYHHHHYHHL